MAELAGGVLVEDEASGDGASVGGLDGCDVAAFGGFADVGRPDVAVDAVSDALVDEVHLGLVAELVAPAVGESDVDVPRFLENELVVVLVEVVVLVLERPALLVDLVLDGGVGGIDLLVPVDDARGL
ncbi:hypothetical protein [Halogeometricum sp. CBA1124]|uniref:hypothetical protein n=1 Tax=Halogeometricum sp. CBA1124 TaxID=2668071 RepID=UPI00142A5C69|nr:hypothetical protein [Halogeometricum sp. CBA1124]MUV57226.1 hypothetical protein [Halogeometricum sp. CBA1124]